MNQRKVLFIGLVWPEPTSSAAGKRILQLVKFFQSKDFELFFCSAASKSEASFDFSDRNVQEFPIKLNNSSFNEFIRKINPEFVVYDRFVSEEQFGWRVTKECPNAVQILDTEDLHFLRSAREKAFKKKEEINLYNEITIREIASILRCDLSLIISEFEMNLLQNEFNIAPSLLHYLPFLEIGDEKQVARQKKFEERKDFVFIGNFIHEPNWQTVLHLKKNIWPKLRTQLPQARLNIYGAYPSLKVFNLHNEKEGFLVHGKAELALEVIGNARILLAPIPFGAGQKGKFIDAMQSGTPIATNSIGAESMFDNLIPGIVENQEELFISKTIELYNDENIWMIARQAGFKILYAKFNKNDFEDTFYQLILDLELNLNEARKRNFIGQILKHNSANALKFMSLWIEEKNSK
ncbi:glycosyltransferase family 4 protein [Moheibacter sediminis]|uniref:Glycosyltransferase involved in cell wall bisynthesis n=1 Tax=Moheibacter sediminis TaxID=1434700 RepID=A0A1W2BUL8_9FLAO|nr:glycosyltransferase family 4 protein [Moheibacter sediminis]SMC76599.1 Glycosyltransferase involved in cell wall bisynthesis [Moheibacter sediminis]